MYYDYDFSRMVAELESIDGTSSDLLTEIRQLRQDQQTFYDKVYAGFDKVVLIIVLSIAVKVLLK